MAVYDKYGREIPDPKPVEWPRGISRPESMQETMRRLIQAELSQVAAAQGLESFEEANDFEVEDEDPELVTEHEIVGMEPELAFGVDADQGVLDGTEAVVRSGGGVPVDSELRGPGRSGESGESGAGGGAGGDLPPGGQPVADSVEAARARSGSAAQGPVDRKAESTGPVDGSRRRVRAAQLPGGHKG